MRSQTGGLHYEDSISSREVAILTTVRFGFGLWREYSNLRHLLVLSICIGTVLGALQTLSYGRAFADDLRDILGIGSDDVWAWIISSLLWSLILASVAAVKLRASPVISHEVHSRVVAILLSIAAVVAGFCTGPLIGSVTRFLPFFDLISSYEIIEKILAHLRLDFDHVLYFSWSVLLAALGFRLARRPPLAAAFAGFCLSLYVAIFALIAVDHIWLTMSGRDQHSRQLLPVFIGLLGLFGITLTIGGHRLGGWLLRQS